MATLTIVPRAQWGARHGRGGTNVTPARGGCALHYNGGPISRGSHNQCAARVRSIENHHVAGNGWAGIAYNWLICEHGIVFEGRGWGRRSAGQGTNAGNQNYLAIMFLMGGSQTLTGAMRTAGRLLILHLRSRGAGNHNRPHSYFTSTSCPGNSVRTWINAGIPSGGGSLPPDPGGGGNRGSNPYYSGRTTAEVQEAVNDLGHSPRLVVDDDYGALTHDGVAWAQRNRLGFTGADVDGKWGAGTESAYIAYTEDDMPQELNYRSNQRQNLPPGEWTTLRFEERRAHEQPWATKAFEPSVLIAGPNDRFIFDTLLSVRAHGLEHGQELQARFYVMAWDASAGSGERSFTLQIGSPVHDAGALHAKVAQKDRLTRNRRLRVEVCHYGAPDQDVHIDFARVDTHYWRY